MRKLWNLKEVLDLDTWEVWLYGVILPAGFVLAALIGSSF